MGVQGLSTGGCYFRVIGKLAGLVAGGGKWAALKCQHLQIFSLGLAVFVRENSDFHQGAQPGCAFWEQHEVKGQVVPEYGMQTRLFQHFASFPFSVSGIPVSGLFNLWYPLVGGIWVSGDWVGLETWWFAGRECPWEDQPLCYADLAIKFHILNLCLTSVCLVSYSLFFIAITLVGS